MRYILQHRPRRRRRLGAGAPQPEPCQPVVRDTRLHDVPGLSAPALRRTRHGRIAAHRADRRDRLRRRDRLCLRPRRSRHGCLLASLPWRCRPLTRSTARDAIPIDEERKRLASGILRSVDVQGWWSGGELVALELGGTEQGVFVRREGSGPSMTLLHGFPSSSHDWAKIAPALAERYALTMPDLLVFGASTKPHEHRYALLE